MAETIAKAASPAATENATAEDVKTTETAIADGDNAKDEDSKNASKTDEADVATEKTPSKPANGTPATSRKNKSTPAKKLNKKASKAKITHTDAKPGDYFMVRLKGHPAWPVIVCDESMLPEAIKKSRPVAAALPDGSYTERFADGGPRISERSFPIMFMGTNDFYWVVNTELLEFNVENMKSTVKPKHLQTAYDVAAEQHDLDYFKQLLQEFAAQAEEMEIAGADSASAKESKKASKSKAKSKVKADDDEDTEMPDADEEEPKTPATASAKSKSKKRKAEDDSKAGDSVKKPRTTIKLNTATTPKAANGTATPKSAKDAKSTKAKPPSKKKKPTADTVTETEADDTEMSAQEKHQKKHKEVLFIRHKLQKGLLDKAQAPKAEEMESMNEWMSSLEKVQPMEESIIASTKIHKLLKAIIKVGHTIPNNDEHKLKERATALLEQWGQTPAPENSFARHDATHGGENGTTGTDSADGAKAAAMPETEKEEAADAAAAKTVEDDAVDKTKETQEKEAPLVEAAA